MAIFDNFKSYPQPHRLWITFKYRPSRRHCEALCAVAIFDNFKSYPQPHRLWITFNLDHPDVIARRLLIAVAISLPYREGKINYLLKQCLIIIFGNINGIVLLQLIHIRNTTRIIFRVILHSSLLPTMPVMLI